MILLYIFLYVLIASVAVFGLLVGAYTYTVNPKDWPWVLCGIFWPVAGLPAAAYIAAGWYLNREAGKRNGKDN